MADTVEKVFLGQWPKFPRAADALLARRCEGPRRISEKRPRPFLSALRRIPTVELSKNQHLRDFWGRSIFDFFNSIAPETDIVGLVAEVRFVPRTDLVKTSQPSKADLQFIPVDP